jgi:hypothetical protein
MISPTVNHTFPKNSKSSPASPTYHSLRSLSSNIVNTIHSVQKYYKLRSISKDIGVDHASLIIYEKAHNWATVASFGDNIHFVVQKETLGEEVAFLLNTSLNSSEMDNFFQVTFVELLNVIYIRKCDMSDDIIPRVRIVGQRIHSVGK